MYASRQRAKRTISTLCWIFLYGKSAQGKTSSCLVSRRESVTSQQGHVRMQEVAEGCEKFTGVCFSIVLVFSFQEEFLDTFLNMCPSGPKVLAVTDIVLSSKRQMDMLWEVGRPTFRF